MKLSTSLQSTCLSVFLSDGAMCVMRNSSWGEGCVTRLRQAIKLSYALRMSIGYLNPLVSEFK